MLVNDFTATFSPPIRKVEDIKASDILKYKGWIDFYYAQ